MPRDLRYINRSRSHEASLRAVLVYLSMISWLGLHQLGLAFCLLVIHHIHRNLFTCFSIIHLQDVQNQTIICANYSTTLCSRVVEYLQTEIIPLCFCRQAGLFFKKGQRCTQLLVCPALIGFHKHTGRKAKAFRHVYGSHVTENRKTVQWMEQVSDDQDQAG